MNDKAIRGILIPYGIVITEGQVVHKDVQFLESVPDVLWISVFRNWSSP